MAFFKFRWPGQKQQGDQVAKPARASRTQSIDAMRRRARHRLIGAAVLVLVGVVGFPMLFDTQPRPIPVDIPIEIPDRNQVAPLVVPAAVAPAAEKAASGAGRAPDALSLDAGEEAVTAVAVSPKPAAPSKPEPRPEAKAQPEAKTPAKVETKPEPKAEAKPEPRHVAEAKPAPRADEAARARALLEGRSTPASTPAVDSGGRFIVQIGAFADAEKAREVHQKLGRAGLKSYLQVVDTKDGKRTRVRVGPFDGRAEAEKAEGRIKALSLPSSILAL